MAAANASGITIRPLEPNDRNAWNELWQGYLTFYKQNLSAEVTETSWNRLVNQQEGFKAIVAVDEDGQLQGLCHFIYHYATWSVGPRCYLEDLFVSVNVRGKGIGKSLIEAVYADAEATGASKVYWHTNEDNARARRLYDYVGVLTPYVKYEGPPSPAKTRPADEKSAEA